MQPSSANLSSSVSDNASAITKATATLTAHSWMYNAFYMNYIDKNHMGDPLYIRGASNNEDEILGTDRFVFKTNGNFTQVEGGFVYKGTWHFSQNVPTTLFMKYDWGTDEDSIVNFNTNHLNFIQSFGYHNDDHSYTELIPAQ